jgi:hypothetical protein
MKWLKSCIAELLGLFVDDGRLAVAILVWVAFCGLVLPRLPLPRLWSAPLLFAGLIGILVESVLRRARQL